MLLGVFLLAGCVPDSVLEKITPTVMIEPTKTEVMSYDLTQVSEHNKAEDCWLAIEGKVYEVTKFIAGQKHPGGEAILQGCGKDATELFNTRPMGSKTPHSDKARTGLENFYIGDLKK